MTTFKFMIRRKSTNIHRVTANITEFQIKNKFIILDSKIFHFKMLKITMFKMDVPIIELLSFLHSTLLYQE